MSSSRIKFDYFHEMSDNLKSKNEFLLILFLLKLTKKMEEISCENEWKNFQWMKKRIVHVKKDVKYG